VSKWTLKPLSLMLLAGELFLIALILVLPQVDLPDVAFGRDTAPIVVNARANCAPAVLVATTGAQLRVAHVAVSGSALAHLTPAAHFSAKQTRVLLSSLRC
jgi:hypothetical protein